MVETIVEVLFENPGMCLDIGYVFVECVCTMLDGAGSIAVADHKAVIGNVQRRNDPVLDPQRVRRLLQTSERLGLF